MMMMKVSKRKESKGRKYVTSNFHRKLIKRERSEVVSEITAVHGVKVQYKEKSCNEVRKCIYQCQKSTNQKKRAYEELSRDEFERIVLPLCRSSVKSVKGTH